MLHRLWMTKDHQGQVEQLSDSAEKGIYIFFDPTQWEKVRVSTGLSFFVVPDSDGFIERDYLGV